MATRLYSIDVEDEYTEVTEAVGSATATKSIELTIDIADTVVNLDGSGTRAITKEEALLALDKLKNYILESDWLPA